MPVRNGEGAHDTEHWTLQQGICKPGDADREKPALKFKGNKLHPAIALYLPEWDDSWSNDVKVAWLRCWDNERARQANKWGIK